MKNNFVSLFKNFSIGDFGDYFSSLMKEEIIKKNNFNFELKQKDINIFFIIIKRYGLNLAKNLDYFKRNKSLNDLIINQHINNKNFKKLYYNQFILLFIYIRYHHKNNTSIKADDSEKKYKEMYNDLYIILLKYYSSTFNKNNHILDFNDMIEIFRFIIFSSLVDLLNNNFIFYLSIIYLIEFLIDNNLNEEKICSILTQLFITLKDKIRLIFLKWDKDIENFSRLKLKKITCLASSRNNELKNIIFQILDLIYNNNYSNNLSSIILNNIKDCFYELKKNYDKNKIINCIKYLSTQVEFNNYLFTKEEKDIFRPSNYFVFDGSKDSGINYPLNKNLFENNFTLVFSFKIEETNKKYPLITFISENIKKEKEIIFNIFIDSAKLFLYFNSKISSTKILISSNNSNIIVVEFYKSHESKCKFIVSNSNNNEKKEVIEYNNINNINNILISSIKIGHIPNELLINNFKNASNFKGIIGLIIFFKNIIDEQFATDILKLKGRYEYILLFNKDNNFENYNYYEESNFYYVLGLIKQKYFLKKIDELCLFTICPLSIINNIDKNKDTFVQDIYNKNNNIKISHYFYTLQKNKGIYARINRKPISIFVEYDGISIYTLIVEYFYNLLRMLINEPKEKKIIITNHIYDALCPILTSITNILCFFRIDSFSNDLDTFEFSLKKLLCLLFDTQPINFNLPYCFVYSLKFFFIDFL